MVNVLLIILMINLAIERNKREVAKTSQSLTSAIAVTVLEGVGFHESATHLCVSIGNDIREMPCQPAGDVKLDVPIRLLFQSTSQTGVVRFSLIRQRPVPFVTDDKVIGSYEFDYTSLVGDHNGLVEITNEVGDFVGAIEILCSAIPVLETPSSPSATLAAPTATISGEDFTSRQDPASSVTLEGGCDFAWITIGQMTVIDNQDYYESQGELLVAIMVHDKEYMTDVQVKTSQPIWGEVLKVAVNREDEVVVRLYDRDWAGLLNVVGQFTGSARQMLDPDVFTVPLRDPDYRGFVGHLVLSASLVEPSSSATSEPGSAKDQAEITQDPIHAPNTIVVRLVQVRPEGYASTLTDNNPHVVLTLMSKQNQSSIVKEKKPNPLWNEDFIFEYDSTDDILHVMVLHDNVFVDSCVGEMNISIEALLNKHSKCQGSQWEHVKDAQERNVGEILIVVNPDKALDSLDDCRDQRVSEDVPEAGPEGEPQSEVDVPDDPTTDTEENHSDTVSHRLCCWEAPAVPTKNTKPIQYKKKSKRAIETENLTTQNLVEAEYSLQDDLQDEMVGASARDENAKGSPKHVTFSEEAQEAANEAQEAAREAQEAAEVVTCVGDEIFEMCPENKESNGEKQLLEDGTPMADRIDYWRQKQKEDRLAKNSLDDELKSIKLSIKDRIKLLGGPTGQKKAIQVRKEKKQNCPATGEDSNGEQLGKETKLPDE